MFAQEAVPLLLTSISNDKSVVLRGLTPCPLLDPDLCNESFFMDPKDITRFIPAIYERLHPRSTGGIT